jgi:flagellar biosynthesis regulator FlbT
MKKIFVLNIAFGEVVKKKRSKAKFSPFYNDLISFTNLILKFEKYITYKSLYINYDDNRDNGDILKKNINTLINQFKDDSFPDFFVLVITSHGRNNTPFEIIVNSNSNVTEKIIDDWLNPIYSNCNVFKLFNSCYAGFENHQKIMNEIDTLNKDLIFNLIMNKKSQCALPKPYLKINYTSSEKIIGRLCFSTLNTIITSDSTNVYTGSIINALYILKSDYTLSEMYFLTYYLLGLSNVYMLPVFEITAKDEDKLESIFNKEINLEDTSNRFKKLLNYILNTFDSKNICEII